MKKFCTAMAADSATKSDSEDVGRGGSGRMTRSYFALDPRG
jgi:hypothetical protein